MTGSRVPRPICGTVDGFDTDTLALTQSTIPGPVCSFKLADMLAEAALRGSHTKAKKVAQRGKSEHPRTVVCPEAGELGNLSARYESGNRGAGAINDGTKDVTGGWSYGKYQIATLTGTMDDFLDYVKTNAPWVWTALDKAGGSQAATGGTPAFRKAWVDLAADSRFGTVQHDFIKSTHYDVLAAKIKTDTGLDVSVRSAALRDVVWSVAVQHGPNSGLISTALKGKNLASITDEQIIDAIYDERERTNVNKQGVRVLKYFSKSTEAVQKDVAARFKQERFCAKKMLHDEQPMYMDNPFLGDISLGSRLA